MARQRRREPLLDGKLAQPFLVSREVRVQPLDRRDRRAFVSTPHFAQTTNGVMQSDVRPAMANLNKATASAQHTLETLDAAITDARPGIKAFSSQTVPQINQLVRNISEMSDSLNAISSKLDRGGAGAVLGGSKLPDYKPRN